MRRQDTNAVIVLCNSWRKLSHTRVAGATWSLPEAPLVTRVPSIYQTLAWPAVQTGAHSIHSLANRGFRRITRIAVPTATPAMRFAVGGVLLFFKECVCINRLRLAS